MEEVWRDIKGYEGLYQVSNLGRVRSLDRTIIRSNGIKNHRKQVILKPKDKNHYYFVNLMNAGKGKTCLIHRLVAEAFIPNPENKPEVDHIDTDKTNNKVNNLRWVTKKENMNNPLTKEKMSVSSIKSDYSKSLSKEVLKYSLDGTFISSYKSLNEVAREYKYSISGISRCCNGKAHSYKGYIWKYKE